MLNEGHISGSRLCFVLEAIGLLGIARPPPIDIHIYRVLQTIQMKLTLLCVWAEPAVLGSAKTALKFKYEI